MTKDTSASQSKKIWGFILTSMFIISCAAAMTYLEADHEVAISALRWIGTGGMFVIGGQALVDSVMHAAAALAAYKSGVNPATVTATTGQSTITVTEKKD